MGHRVLKASTGLMFALLFHIGANAESPIHSMTIPLDDIHIKGYLLSPEKTAYIDTLIIVLHGWLPENDNGAEVSSPYAKQLAKSGFNTLAISMRGWPDTGGIDDCGHQQSLDIAKALSWIKQHSSIKPKSIGLIGFSQGGQVALLTAAKSQSLNFVVAYYPVTDIKKWQQTSNIRGITHDYIPNTCATPPGIAIKSPINHVSKITTPILFIHGDEDFRVPTEQSLVMVQAMKASSTKPSLLIIEGGGHGNFSNQQSTQAYDETIAFIVRNLH
jgi:dipeptidyl aminopeptidase/acylaminoacyl peptidase